MRILIVRYKYGHTNTHTHTHKGAGALPARSLAPKIRTTKKETKEESENRAATKLTFAIGGERLETWHIQLCLLHDARNALAMTVALALAVAVAVAGTGPRDSRRSFDVLCVCLGI